MPIVRLTMGAGRDSEQKAAVATDITKSLMKRCGVDPANVNILFEDIELDQWILGSDTIGKPDPGLSDAECNLRSNCP